MSTFFSSTRSNNDPNEVILHVYDLSMGMAASLSQSFLGVKIDLIPHTGIVIRNREYFYGGGIQAVPPHQVSYIPSFIIILLRL